MDASARIGEFSVGDGSYGVPVATVKPANNSVVPATPAQQTADQTQSQLDAIYAQLKAAAGATAP